MSYQQSHFGKVSRNASVAFYLFVFVVYASCREKIRVSLRPTLWAAILSRALCAHNLPAYDKDSDSPAFAKKT